MLSGDGVQRRFDKSGASLVQAVTTNRHKEARAFIARQSSLSAPSTAGNHRLRCYDARVKELVWWTVWIVVFVACHTDPQTSGDPQTGSGPQGRAVEQVRVPAAVAFVFESQEIFVGNEQVEPDPNKQYPGTLRNMKKAFTLAAPANELPAGSLGMLIAYADTPTVRLPMQPIANMTPEALGTQQD